MASTLITSVAFLAGLSHPAPLVVSVRVAKRGGESVYPVNCQDSGGASRMYYYAADGNYPPPEQSSDITDGGYVTWEGRKVGGYLGESGATFTSSIQAGAKSYKNYAYARTGYNGHTFDCYKDDGHTIQETTCQSIYYCFPQ